MDFLGLLAFTGLLLAVLLALGKFRPAHALWDRVDVAYYSLALLGVMLFFLAESDERSLARASDANNTHTLRLEQLKRFNPAFAPSYPGDPSIPEAVYDLLEIQKVAVTCRLGEQGQDECAAARQFSSDIGEAFGLLTEPPLSPTVAEAKLYATRFCDAVQRLEERSVDTMDPQVRRPFRAGLEKLAAGAERDAYTMTKMRQAISEANPTRTHQVGFAITLLNAASACPENVEHTGQFDARLDQWVREVQLVEAAVREAELGIMSSTRGAEDRSPGETMLWALIKGLWPFFVSGALCLKLARALRDQAARASRTE